MSDEKAPSTLFHGGGLDAAIARHGGARGDWLDLSTGINPVAWPVPDLPQAAWARLPDGDAMARLLDAARRCYGVDEAFEIVAAPGTQALIEVLPRLLPGKTATVVAAKAGTYGEHAHCCAKAGRSVVMATSADAVDGDEMLTIAVRPNNPDGAVAPHADMVALHDRLAARGGTLIVDEAFCDTVPGESLAATPLARAVILRSFGKFFGLAGLRLGFAICPAEIAAALRVWLGPWAVSGPALAIGAAALGDDRWIADSRMRLAADCGRLASMLRDAGFEIAGRHDLFVLGRHRQANTIHDALCAQHILTRPFERDATLLRFGLPGDDAGFERLARALSGLQP